MNFSDLKNVFPGGVNSPVRSFSGLGIDPPVLARGEGAYVYDVSGKKYLDFVLSWGPLIAGHAHPAVVSAVHEQIKKGSSFGALSEPEIQLGQWLQQQWPSLERLRFVNSGTEATMSAIRVARAFAKRDGIIKFAGCYHGHADYLLVKAGSGATTLGIPSSQGVPVDFTKHTYIAQYNDLLSVEAILDAHPEKIAAVIIEPVAGNMGFIWPREGFLKGLRQLCTQHGVLLIFDEVMTGFRLSFRGAEGLFGVRPDLTCLGKVIGGGLPVGAYGGRADIMDMLAPAGPVYQAGTLSGNPLAMACGLATLQLCTVPGFYQRLDELSQMLVLGLKQAAAKAGVPLWARAQAGMFGFGFLEWEPSHYEEVQATSVPLFKRFFVKMLERGYWLPPSTFEALFVSSAHSDEDSEGFLRAASAVLAELG